MQPVSSSSVPAEVQDDRRKREPIEIVRLIQTSASRRRRNRWVETEKQLKATWTFGHLIITSLVRYLNQRGDLEMLSDLMYSTGLRCYCIVWASATNAAAWLRHTKDYCAFLLERREPNVVPSPCGHRCMVRAAVCLTVMPASYFRYNRRFNYRPQFQDRQNPHVLKFCLIRSNTNKNTHRVDSVQAV